VWIPHQYGTYIDECPEFKEFLQDLINRHMIQVYHQKKEEEVLVEMSEEPYLLGPKPQVMHFTRESLVPSRIRLVVIQVPSPFPYKNDKANHGNMGLMF